MPRDQPFRIAKVGLKHPGKISVVDFLIRASRAGRISGPGRIGVRFAPAVGFPVPADCFFDGGLSVGSPVAVVGLIPLGPEQRRLPKQPVDSGWIVAGVEGQ